MLKKISAREEKLLQKVNQGRRLAKLSPYQNIEQWQINESWRAYKEKVE